MHYNEHKPTNEVLDSLASNSYTQIIIQPNLHNLQKPYWEYFQ